VCDDWGVGTALLRGCLCSTYEQSKVALLQEQSPELFDDHCIVLLFWSCRAIGVAAGVPIEPSEQQALADATCALPGVLAAGVPGAGGYDALFCILAEADSLDGGAASEGATAGEARSTCTGVDGSIRAAVESLWLRWPGGGLTPLLLTNGPAFGEPGAGVLLERKHTPA